MHFQIAEPPLEGRAYKSAAPYGWNGTNPTAERVKIQWVVRANPGETVHLTARHERAGIALAPKSRSPDRRKVR